LKLEGLDVLTKRLKGHNGKENPIGIETGGFGFGSGCIYSHNGKENPIGIETTVSQPF